MCRVLGAWHRAWFLWLFCKLTIPSQGEVFHLRDYWQSEMIYSALVLCLCSVSGKVVFLVPKSACMAPLSFKMLSL